MAKKTRRSTRTTKQQSTRPSTGPVPAAGSAGATRTAGAGPGGATKARPASADAAPRRRSGSADRTRALEAARKSRARRSTLRLALLGVPLLAAGGILVATSGVLLPEVGIAAPLEGGVGVHVEPGSVLPQRNRPPSSGPHYQARAPYGVSSTPIEPGLWIHALEHGAIAVLFQCADEEECASIADRVDEEVYSRARVGAFGERKLVGTPYQDMDTPFAAVAWGRVLPLE